MQVTSSDNWNGTNVVNGPLGTGPVTFAGVSAFTGGSKASTLPVQAQRPPSQAGNTSIGNAAATANNANDYETSGITLHNTINFINSVASLLGKGINGGGDINLAGTINVAGTNVVGTAVGPNVVISGTVQNQSTANTGGLVKVNTGLLQLTGNNTFTGGVITAVGTLVLGNNNALGTGFLTMDCWRHGVEDNGDLSPPGAAPSPHHQQ